MTAMTTIPNINMRRLRMVLLLQSLGSDCHGNPMTIMTRQVSLVHRQKCSGRRGKTPFSTLRPHVGEFSLVVETVVTQSMVVVVFRDRRRWFPLVGFFVSVVLEQKDTL